MTDLTPTKHERRDLKEALLDPQMQSVFSALVPRHMTADRMLRLSIACITRTPKLLEVPQVQVLGALVQCAGIGLEPNSPLQQVHLLPFRNNRTNRYDLQTIIGYRGYVELGRRTGKQSWVHGDVVRPSDEFSYAYGNDAHLRHKPGRGGSEREAPTDAYCFVQLKDGFAFTVLPEWEVLRHRQHSFAYRQEGERSIWGQHADRMWRKTAIRVLYSGGEVPLDTELAMAVNTDDQKMDYRAMGEMALRGGKSAIEHLKEGMDTFVAEEPEAEPEQPPERVVEIRSQVRPAQPRQEAAPRRPVEDQPPASPLQRRPGRPKKPETIAREIIAEINACAPADVQSYMMTREEDIALLPQELQNEIGAAAQERAAASDDDDDGDDDGEADDHDGPQPGPSEQERYVRWIAEVHKTALGCPTIGHVKSYRQGKLVECDQWEDRETAEREVNEAFDMRLQQLQGGAQ